MQPSPPPPPDPLLDTVAAGRYRIIKLLGEGGMGRVYLAEHIAIEKRMALKVLRAEYAHKGDIVTRFQQEAISASRIKHPNVLDVFDFGRLENGCFFLAMEFLEGNDLADEIQRHRTLDPVSAVRIALQICRALGAAHSKGVVHRDLKPENVFLQRHDDEQLVKIVDFGIAQLRSKEEAAAESKHRRLTKTGMIFGTPEYMAPEQAAGKRADPRADIYALGVMLYEMFTGAVPFTGETFLGVLAKHLNETPPPMTTVAPDLAASPQLQATVFRALAKNPDERYQSMAEFAQALLATPEGQLVSRNPAAILVREPGGAFVAPATGSATAPEFGVVSSPPPRARDPRRAAATVPRGSGDPETSRAETQLGAEASSDAPRRGRSFGLRSGAAAVLLVALGVGAFLARGTERTRPGHETSGPPRAPAVAAPSSELPAPAEPARATAAAPVGTASAAVPVSVTLEVVTDPPGATLAKNGFQVCDATPCEVAAAPNETLELEASKGAMQGKARVLAQRNQKVSIRLTAPARVARPAKKVAARMCEVEVDGLKILRACP